MRWVLMVEVIRADGTRETVELGSVQRGPSTSANDVGLTLAESKPLVAQLQAFVVHEQLRRHSGEARVCATCGTRRALKDYRGRRIATALGTVSVKTPRFQACHCPGGPLSITPVSQLLQDRTTPELRHL
jgi:hypothetical protein